MFGPDSFKLLEILEGKLCFYLLIFTIETNKKVYIYNIYIYTVIIVKFFVLCL